MKGKTAEYLSYLIHILTIILYFVLLFVLDDPPSLGILNIFGFIFLGLGVLFVAGSLVAHHGKGKGTRILQMGVYGIVRHPMYLGAIFFFAGMVCFLPHWVMVILGTLNILLIYRFMLVEEEQNIRKFGEPYRSYMTTVPRLNLVIGIIRWIRQRREKR